MGCAGSLLLLLLLSLSALSASTAEANKESLGENVGRKWFLRGRRAMAAGGHGDARKDQVVGAKSTGANPAHVNGGVKTVEVAVVGPTRGGRREFAGANQEADHAPAGVVHDESKGTATRAIFRQGARDRRSHDDTATVAAEMLRVDYSVYADVHSRRPINNDAPLDELAEKKP